MNTSVIKNTKTHLIKDAQWEKVTDGFFRIAVPGGWVVAVAPGNEHILFLSDEAHEWDIV